MRYLLVRDPKTHDHHAPEHTCTHETCAPRPETAVETIKREDVRDARAAHPILGKSNQIKSKKRKMAW